jgi:hypothetical protein
VAPGPDEVEPITCPVCHDVKSANPSMLRVFGSQSIPSRDTALEAGASAMCLRCHNAQVDPRAPDTLTRRLAPMGGAQSDVFYGSGAMEVPADPAPQHAATLGCVDCHMRAPDDAGLAGAVGGHTFLVRAADGRASAAVCSGCHDGAADFDVLALGDYDGDGTVEPARAEVRGLLALARDALGAAITAAHHTDCQGLREASGFDEVDGRIVLVGPGDEPLRDCDGNTTVFTDDELGLHRAAFDLLLVERDRSEGLHAPRYVAAILQAAVTSVLGAAVPPWDGAGVAR